MGYGSNAVHLLFNLWYRDFNHTPSYDNNLPQVDHIFPQSVLKDVKVLNPETGRMVTKYREAQRNQLANSMLLSNDNTDGPAVVTIAETDKGFDSNRCGTWTKDLSPITASPTAPFTEGTYIVGTDIAPGTWRSESGSNCYWARLKGFSGELGNTIANDITGPSAIVTIDAGDAGFDNTRCGTWTKVQ